MFLPVFICTEKFLCCRIYFYSNFTKRQILILLSETKEKKDRTSFRPQTLDPNVTNVKENAKESSELSTYKLVNKDNMNLLLLDSTT